MPLEIERKFVVTTNEWRTLVSRSYTIKQGYLNLAPERTVRVRVKEDEAFITIKGKSIGITRAEFEYEIPVKEAEQLLELCEGVIILKTRHEVVFEHKLWEVDVFEGENTGLIMAEIELTAEEENFKTPAWVGKEVSTDSRYYNSNLVKNPFANW